MASLSCRISPRTSTVILRDRSPLATAMVTSEMFRTCAVRLLAIELTLSVRSFHTPLTSRTCAWPPSLPSVPTSRATRVTSEVNTPSCSIIVLTMVAERRNSPSSGRPSTSSRTVCSRSPLATAASARVTSWVGHSRSSMSVLTERSISPQAPPEPENFTRWRVLPCLPTTVPTRSSSLAIRAFAATISLKVSAILPSTPVQSPGRRTEKSPSRTAWRARSSLDTWSCGMAGTGACPARARSVVDMRDSEGRGAAEWAEICPLWEMDFRFCGRIGTSRGWSGSSSPTHARPMLAVRGRHARPWARPVHPDQTMRVTGWRS